MTAVDPSVGGSVALWCDPDVVKNDARLKDVTLPDGISYQLICAFVSRNLWQLTGHRWMGAQTVTIRPTRLLDTCSCDLGILPQGEWSGDPGWWLRSFPEGWGCGCGASSEYVLPGGNVIAVEEVLVDGEVLVPETDYQLFDNRRLVRMSTAGALSAPQWPCCQRLQIPTTEVGTWQIRYRFGPMPPPGGVLAAYTWAVDVAKRNSTSNRLPSRTQSVRSQDVDITIEGGAGIAEGRTGLPDVDMFIESCNPHSVTKRARIFSPDTIAPAVVSRTQT